MPELIFLLLITLITIFVMAGKWSESQQKGVLKFIGYFIITPFIVFFVSCTGMLFF